MKKTTAPTPPDLAGANVAYCKRLAELAQESQQRWLQLGQRLAGDTAGQYFASFGPLKVDGNWQKIAPALGEATRKHWQCQLEASQAITMPRSKTRRRWPPVSAKPSAAGSAMPRLRPRAASRPRR